ncbi:MAG: tetratricopeptide repeat protein [Acidobacteriota bacterium]
MHRWTRLAVLVVGFSARAVDLPMEEGERLALAALGDAGYRSDVRGIELARDRIAAAIADGATAPREYRIALAEWLLSNASMADPPAALSAAERSKEHLDRALELDPSYAQAYALASRVTFALTGLGKGDRKQAYAEMNGQWKKAMELGPDVPEVILADAVMLTYAPAPAGGDPARGRARFHEGIGRLELAAAFSPEAALWRPMAWSWLGMAFLYSGDMLLAREAFEHALALRPDYAQVRDALLPMTDVVDGGRVPDPAKRKWLPLVEDPAGDGRQKAPDLLRAAWSTDAPSGMLFVRIDLETPADPAALGVNVAFDTDGDAATGAPWWAGNTGFNYDRLATVWVARGSDGRLRGTAGVTDARGGAEGRFTSLSRGVTFALFEDNRVIVIGVPLDSLGAARRLRAVVTVGSNTMWNDTAPDAGSARLDLP